MGEQTTYRVQIDPAERVSVDVLLDVTHALAAIGATHALDAARMLDEAGPGHPILLTIRDGYVGLGQEWARLIGDVLAEHGARADVSVWEAPHWWGSYGVHVYRRADGTTHRRVLRGSATNAIP